MRRSLIFCAALFLCLSMSLSVSSASTTKLVRRVMTWPTTGLVGKAAWNQQGTLLVYHETIGSKARVGLLQRVKPKLRTVFTTRNGFWPVFGPLDAIFSGPENDKKPLPVKSSARRKTKRTRSRTRTSFRRKPRKKLRPRPKPRVRKPAPRSRKPKKRASKKKAPKLTWGIRLAQGSQSSLLFPGVRPLYSQAARRLVFSFRGVLYLWNPMLSTKKLLMLARGNAPRWSPNGRAMLFLQKPFAKGGGVWVVDMRFRAARLTRTGGEATWGTRGKSIYYVGKHPRSRKWGIAKLLLKGKKPKPVWLVQNGRSPHLPPNARKPGQPLLAYHDSKGVWVQHLKTGKRLLIARHGRDPLWSSRGELLVHFRRSLSLFKLTPAGLTRLSRKQGN